MPRSKTNVPHNLAPKSTTVLTIKTGCEISFSMPISSEDARGINGETKIKEKNPEQNKFRFPLNNLNLKDVDSGWERQFRRSRWLGKGLTVEVNEFGKRRVSWQRYSGDKQAVKPRMSLGDGPSAFRSPCTLVGPVIAGPNAEEGNLESCSSDLSSNLNGASSQVYPVSSVPVSLPPRRSEMALMVNRGSNSSFSALEVPGGSGFIDQVSPSWLTHSPTLPILTAEAVQETCELSSPLSTPICASLEQAEVTVLSSGDPLENLEEKSSSPAATKYENDESLELESSEDARGINGETKIKEKNPEQNKFRFPLNNLNLKDVDSGWERQFRRSRWLGKGLTVEVNEFGKRRVSWQRYSGDKQAVKPRMSLGDGPSAFRSPCTLVGPVIAGPNAEEGNLESCSSDLSSNLNGASSQVYPVSSVPVSLPPRRSEMALMVNRGSNSSFSAPEVPGGSGFIDQVSPSWLTHSPTLPILTAEAVQETCELSSPLSAPIYASLEQAEVTVLSSGDPLENLEEKSSSPAATKYENDESLEPEVRWLAGQRTVMG
nr:hypothetical protein CFP56_46101 [Quercus suber]